MVAELHATHSYPVSALCELLGLPRSSYYYRPTARDDAALRQAIESVAAEFPTYGSRRITQQLRRPPYQVVVNRKQVQRLMGEMGLKQPPKRRQQRTTNSCHGYPRFANLVMGLRITYPNQVWVSDISYVRLRQDFVYLAVVLDVFTPHDSRLASPSLAGSNTDLDGSAPCLRFGELSGPARHPSQ